MLLFAAGSAIAPIRALVQHLIRRRDRFGRVTLFYGQRHGAEFAYLGEHMAWERRGVRVVLCPSAPTTPGRGSAGASRRWRAPSRSAAAPRATRSLRLRDDGDGRGRPPHARAGGDPPAARPCELLRTEYAPAAHAQRLLISMLVVAIALTAVLVWPFWVAFFLAAVISATLRSWMEWLARKLRGRRELAAAILTIGVLLAVVLPIARWGPSSCARSSRASSGSARVRERGIGGILRRLPGPLGAAQKLIQAVPQPQQQIQRIAGSKGSRQRGWSRPSSARPAPSCSRP